MKKAPSKKGSPERRKTPRSSAKSPGKRASSARKELSQDHCANCGKNLARDDRALFVEEELGRVFCAESCIAAFFTPDIERLEKEYFRKLSPQDLSGEEREALAHLRWVTLQEPDEVWQEKTLSGDLRYTLISEFEPGDRRVWCVCICLFLRGEPSFLYLAFPTRNPAMANFYRRGERVEWVKPEKSRTPIEAAPETPTTHEDDKTGDPVIDGLADDWTEEETFRAQLNQERSAEDIPSEEYALYQTCIEETLENPDEVWSIGVSGKAGGEQLKLYHFIRHYPDEAPGIWYMIIARETEDDEEQIEILDAFPTRDSQLVDRYRRGTQEVGALDPRPASNRVVH
ncbi:MAG: PBECR2 nuclease fold domain-containing protein [Bdellovibrionota bacterium]